MAENDETKHIAFIGVGAMGYGMASNIRKKMPSNATLYINDPNTAACDRFKSEYSSCGPIEIVQTARECAEKAGTLLSMVPRSDDVKTIYLDETNGVLAAGRREGLLMLECSTIDPKTTREAGQVVMQAVGGVYVDAPVSGGIAGAASGNLALMIGHPSKDDQLAARIRSVVDMMANPAKIFFCGPLGSGLAAKISNNYLSGSFNVAISEAMSIGIRSGVDPQILFDVIRSSSGQSWMGENHQPVPGLVESAPSSRGYQRSFGIEMMLKDISLGIAAAGEVGVEPSMARTARSMYERACTDEECKGLDYTSVYKIVQRDAEKKSSSL